MDGLRATLTRKAGPLPGWGYLVLGAVAFLAWRFYRGRMSPIASSQTPSGQLSAANQAGLISALQSALEGLVAAGGNRPAATGMTPPPVAATSAPPNPDPYNLRELGAAQVAASHPEGFTLAQMLTDPGLIMAQYYVNAANDPAAFGLRAPAPLVPAFPGSGPPP